MDIDGDRIDLVGAPFAVLESDPGLFTMLIRQLGVQGLEVTEVYDMAPWVLDRLNPRGLIFCYLCTEGASPEEDECLVDSVDPDAEDIWFAHQLSDDACASQAILNVLFNCHDVELGNEMRDFYTDTLVMTPEMKGLSVTNSAFLRAAHNSFARCGTLPLENHQVSPDHPLSPADIRASYHAIATKTVKQPQRKASEPTPKKRKANRLTSPRKKVQKNNDRQDMYHYIGYAPRNGKVWELDGLRFSGPLEVGGIPSGTSWTDIVRPVLQMRMQKYVSGASGEADHIKYSLLAIVDDKYCQASDQMEMLKRERNALERRMREAYSDGWEGKVDASLLGEAEAAFATSVQSSTNGQTFAHDFGSRKMEKELTILEMPVRNLGSAWESCVQAAMNVKLTIEDEVDKAKLANTEHVSRTFDFEPFIQDFITSMHHEKLLSTVLGPPNRTKKSNAK